MKLRALLLCTVLWMPAPAHAGPVGLFFSGLAAGFGGGVGAAVAGALGGAAAFGATIGTFLGSTALGGLLVNLGASALLGAIFRPKAPSIPDAQVNVRLDNAVRWMAGGKAAIGGAVVFMEFDNTGNFWIVLAHADSEVAGDVSYLLDGRQVTRSDGTDGFVAGEVLTDEFCVDADLEPYNGGTKRIMWRLHTVTPAAGSVYGALPSDFAAAFPSLPADFRGAGVAYTVMRCRPLPPKRRANGYRWRGPVGIGEPAVTIIANWSRMYDPRNGAHVLADPATWTAGDGNPAILWAWFRTHPRGKGRPASEVNWTQVAAAANACDVTVLDRTGTPIPRYRAGVAFPDNKARAECEAEILAAMDAFIAYDDQGRAYPVPGVYTAPTVTFTAERDILSAQTQVVDDGEASLDGVIVNYTSPDHGWTKQPAAPWKNPLYYDGTSEPRYEIIDILACQNHNQAVRLGKAYGQRKGAARKAALGTTIKGLLAKDQRAIDLQYDDTFSGPHEIVTAVEEDASGQVCRFAVVPLGTDRWSLGAGEEGDPPEPTPALSIDNSLAAASGVVVTAQRVKTSGGWGVRLRVTFSAPSRADREYRFRYTKTGSGEYDYMSVEMEDLRGVSAPVDDGEVYQVSWQTVSAAGRATDWSTPVSITAVANTTAPDPLVAANATGGVGSATLTWTTANDANQYAVRVRRGTTSVYGSSSPVATIVTPANTAGGATDAVGAGSYWYWFEPVNASGVTGTTTAAFAVTVT